MKGGKWQGRGASAPETVLVEQKVPLIKRIAAIAVVLALGAALLVWGVDLGRRIIGASQGAPGAAAALQEQQDQQQQDQQRQQLQAVQAELERVTAERDALLTLVKKAGLPLPAPEAKTVAPEPKPGQETKP